jgi:hypothetical protein
LFFKFVEKSIPTNLLVWRKHQTEIIAFGVGPRGGNAKYNIAES